MDKTLVVQDQQIQVARNPVMDMLAAAVEKGSDASVKELVQILREERDYNAQLAFNHAMHQCQLKMKPISADMENPQTRSKYASYVQVDRKIRPIYTEEGLSLSFGDGERIGENYIRIVCYVSHIGGHTRMYYKDMPIVTTGAQGKAMMTAIHAHGSADSYAKRYLIKDIFNLSIGEDDDDGNGGENIPPGVTKAILSMMEAETVPAMMEIYKKSAKEAFESGDKKSVQALVASRDKRKAELEGSGNGNN